VEQLGAAKLLRDGRVAVEKPFGHDLASARELNAGCTGCCARARSWGAEEAEALVRGHPRWQQPWLPTES
jgi:Glucose-6-phosphate dehydrogenase, NAD binding domain